MTLFRPTKTRFSKVSAGLYGSFRVGRRGVVALLVAAINLALASPSALACECAPPPPPCAAYAGTPIIFLGTVVDALETTDNYVVRARVQIDKAYKGISSDTVTLFDDGMCGGPPLRVGEQYLIYTYDPGTGALPSGSCTRSRNAKYASEDLAFLNSLSTTAPTATLTGKVTIVADDITETKSPASDVAVEIQGEGKFLTTMTDSEGRYTFAGLKPGSYVARTDKPGFREEEPEHDSGKVPARGCAIHDVVLRKIWPGTVTGRVSRPDGSPPPAGMGVNLIRIEGSGPNQKSDPLIETDVRTDESGMYSFSGVAPGSYKVVLNLYQVPTGKYPYPTLYWPGVSTEATASAVEINESTESLRCDFRLPVALQSTPVDFVVLLPDGKPAKHIGANIATHRDGMATWAGTVNTDASGKFSFPAIEGFEYTVRDIMTNQARMASNVSFSASDHTQPITIRLVPKE